MANIRDTRINANSSLKLPAGTTSQRPSSPATGMLRYNTDNNEIEVYNGTEWRPVVIDTGLFEFSSHTFTTAGSTGRFGPGLSSLRSEYSFTSWADNNEFFTQGEDTGFQRFTIPSEGTYELTAQGGSGGRQEWAIRRGTGVNRPRGAEITANFNFSQGEKIQIIVGQKGLDNKSQYDNSGEGEDAGPGGGGGTFVFYDKDDSQPILAAGGGAGGTRRNYSQANANFSGPDGFRSETDNNGGSNRNGGRRNTGGPSYWAGGGAGWLTDGTGGNQDSNYNRSPGTSGAQGGQSPRRGAAGGSRWQDGTDSGGDGSFGGGGGGGSDNMGTGGGGGYSGGGGADRGNGNGGGGGGGSYIGSSDSGPGSEVERRLGSYGDGYLTIRKL